MIELLVGMAIGLFLTATAIAFARYETKLLGVSTESLDVQRAGRLAIDLLARDLKEAGAGVGYLDNGVFAGLKVERFTWTSLNPAATLAFNSTGTPLPENPGFPPPQGAGVDIPLNTSDGTVYTVRSTDLMILRAGGSYATIADYTSAGPTGQICAGPDIDFEPNELVVLRNEDGIAAHAFLLTGIGSPGACTKGQCLNGCRTFTGISQSAFLETGPGASALSYLSGEMHGGLEAIAWFVVPQALAIPGSGTDVDNIGVLRRATFDGNRGCNARDNTCGAAVSEYVETLQVQVWKWDSVARTWSNAGQTPLDGRVRLRVDIELVTRNRTPNSEAGRSATTLADARRFRAVRLRLAGGVCIPAVANCPAPPQEPDLGDAYEREVYRTSVEIWNASYMTMGDRGQ